MRYIVLIDGSPRAYGVVFPDLPGCTAMADTLDEAMAAAGAALGDWVRTVETGSNAPPAARSTEALRVDPEVSQALTEGASHAAIG
jgi:predicted RNase H-like HicB family nuclease